ncbi:hypothetical protein ACOSQ2_022073 [Xanthoceras sorbifolium]
MASSSSSSSSNPVKYDVFLSFRGEDTRRNFTSYLYDALCRKQIETFIDNNELRRGDEISPSLSKAIQDSSLSIIVFSANYASSSWCLNELLEILESMKTRGQIVLPVFYHVTPSDIRKQTGTYKKAFDEHEKRFKKTKDKVRNWRAALTQVANLSGWDLNQHDGTESEFVEKIAKDVLKRLNHMSSSDYLDGFVGLTSRMESIESLLCIGMKNIVRIIGIWGMGGIGKTTIARAILIRIAHQFDGHCFLENVKDVAKYGPNHLQEKLLCEIFEDRNVHINAFTLNRLRRKKILVILDDVDDLDHIDFLVRGHSSFGVGSRIIITSRDKQVLKNGVDELYELEELNYHEALQLFCLNAFKQNHPPENYTELSNRVICYAKGNPLSLKVLGRFLFDRSKLEWKSSLNKLKKCPNLKIQNVLRISYDGLDRQEKEIFLSIACFFKGKDKDRVIAILDDCRLFAEIGIAVLVDKCLLTVTRNLLLMHDLIQEMGRGIVLQESFNEPGKRSRLWSPQDILNLFKNNIGTNAVESISLDLSQISDQLQLSHDAFMRMPGLKFLKFYNYQHYGGYNEKDQVQLHQGLELLPDELRYLHWHRYPLKSLPSNFKPDHLVELEMPYSKIEQLWKDNQPLENLRRIDLSYSRHLMEAPNISQVSNLEIMALHGCSSLTKFPSFPCNIEKLYLSHTAIEEIPPAIETLNKLVVLNLQKCTKLKNLPSSISHLTSLEHLDLSGCSSITEFPEVSGNVESLILQETAIEEVPSSVPNLEIMILHGCSSLAKFPGFPCNIKDLYLSHTAIEEIPPAIESLNKLVTLKLENCTRLKNLPSNIGHLTCLKKLDLSDCSSVTEFPNISCSMETLYLSGTAIEEVPSSVEHLTKLSQLCLRNCTRLKRVSRGIFKLEFMSYLSLEGCSKLDNLAINNTEGPKRKRRSSVSFCFPGSEIPEWIEDQSEGSSITMDLPPNWYSNEFFGFALCIVAAFEDSNDHEDFFIEWTCNFIDNDDEWHEVFCHVDNVTVIHPVSKTATFGRPKSKHVFFVAPNHELYEMFKGNDDGDGDGDGDGNFSIEKYSSCEEAFFQFSVLDTNLCPLPNCKVTNCGVRLLNAEDMESTEICNDIDSSGDQAERVESERDSISEDDEEDPNLEEPEVDEHCNCLLFNCFSFLFQRWN